MNEMNCKSGTPRVLFYYRVSTEEQRDENFSIETQRVRCHAKADQIFGVGGYEFVELEDDQSGGFGLEKTGVARKTRPGWVKAAELINGGSFDVLICYDVFRFARSLRWQCQFLEDVLIPSKTALITVADGIDTRDENSVMNLQVLTLVGESHRKTHAKRCKDAQMRRVEEGYVSGQTCYGWRWAPRVETNGRHRREIEPVPEEAHWIKKMADWYLAGWSSSRIARELNRQCVPPPSGGGKWGESSVLKVIFNPRHAGLLKLDDKYIEGRHSEYRFYDRELFERLVEEKKGRKRWKTNTQRQQRSLLLGIATCRECGKSLRAACGEPGRRFYRCPGNLTSDDGHPPGPYIPAEPVEEAVVEAIKVLCGEERMQRLAADEAVSALGDQDGELAVRRDILRGQLSKLQDQFAKWADMLTSGTITESEFRDFRSELVRRRESAEQQLAEVESSLASRDSREKRLDRVLDTLRDFPRAWAHLNFDERRRVLDTLVERLAVGRRNQELTIDLKLCLLPEQTITLQIQKKPRKEKPKGVAGLTERQLALLKHVDDGKTLREIAGMWEVTEYAVSATGTAIRQQVGVHDLREAAAMARTRIDALLPGLPLKGRSPLATTTAQCKLPPSFNEILGLMCSGANNVEIARMTGLKWTTVAGRRARIMRYFNAKTAFEVHEKAKAMGLV